MPALRPASIAVSVGLAALASLAGCAPTTLSPMAMRLAPLEPQGMTTRLGFRSGPRLSVPISRPREFRGDDAPFSFPQWAVAYDAQFLAPLGEQFALHLGLQGELGCGYHGSSCPVPVPGYGASVGFSQYVPLGPLSVAPAVMLRGATDFGFGSLGGPGSLLGAEASLSLALHDGDTSVGLVPFCGVHRVIGDRGDTSALYFGAVLAGHFSLGGGDALELSAGLGRVRMDNGPSWTVPLLGLSATP